MREHDRDNRVDNNSEYDTQTENVIEIENTDNVNPLHSKQFTLAIGATTVAAFKICPQSRCSHCGGTNPKGEIYIQNFACCNK